MDFNIKNNKTYELIEDEELCTIYEAITNEYHDFIYPFTETLEPEKQDELLSKISKLIFEFETQRGKDTIMAEGRTRARGGRTQSKYDKSVKSHIKALEDLTKNLPPISKQKIQGTIDLLQKQIDETLKMLDTDFITAINTKDKVEHVLRQYLAEYKISPDEQTIKNFKKNL